MGQTLHKILLGFLAGVTTKAVPNYQLTDNLCKKLTAFQLSTFLQLAINLQDKLHYKNKKFQ